MSNDLDHSLSRRCVIKIVSAGGAALTSMPETWVKPMVNAVVLPAHAVCSSVDAICYPVSVSVLDFDATPPSGGNANFVVEVVSQASVCDAVRVVLSVDNGLLVGTANDSVHSRYSMIVVWTGEGVPNAAIPLSETNLSLSWICSDGQTGTELYDLRAMAISQTGGLPLTTINGVRHD